jgi:hypothetical protein
VASKIILFASAIILLLTAGAIANGVPNIVTLQAPEPTTMILMGLAVVALRMLRKRLD